MVLTVQRTDIQRLNRYQSDKCLKPTTLSNASCAQYHRTFEHAEPREKEVDTSTRPMLDYETLIWKISANTDANES